MSKSINPMLFLNPDTGLFPARPPCHRLDEFADGYSLTGCSPALPVSASPASHHSRVDSGNLSTVYSSLSGLSRTVKANYQHIGGPLLMIEVGQSRSIELKGRSTGRGLCARNRGRARQRQN